MFSFFGKGKKEYVDGDSNKARITVKDDVSGHILLPVTAPTGHAVDYPTAKSSRFKDAVQGWREGKDMMEYIYYNSASIAESLPEQVLGNASYQTLLYQAYADRPWYKQLVDNMVNGEPGSLCRKGLAQSLRLPQLITHTHFTHLARVVENHPQDYPAFVPRGTLVMHSTGAGKTNVQSGIIDAFHDLVVKQNWRIYMITTPKNARTNNMAEFADKMYFYPHFEGMSRDSAINYMRDTLHMTDSSSKSAERRPNWTTYAQMYKSMQSNAAEFRDKSARYLFVLDEVHSTLANTPKSKDAQNIPRKFVREVLSKFGDQAMIIMLTATPGMTVENLLEL